MGLRNAPAVRAVRALRSYASEVRLSVTPSRCSQAGLRGRLCTADRKSRASGAIGVHGLDFEFPTLHPLRETTETVKLEITYCAV